MRNMANGRLLEVAPRRKDSRGRELSSKTQSKKAILLIGLNLRILFVF